MKRLEILMKGRKFWPRQLYMLHGDTIVGGATVASSLFDEENT